MADRVYERAIEIIAEELGICGVTQPTMAAQGVVDRLIVEGLTITDPETIDD